MAKRQMACRYISVNLNDVLVTETTAWAVGDSGTVLRYEDGKWTENQTGLPKKNLTTIWGTGATDIWVAGDGIVAHYTDAWKLVTFNQPLPSDLPIRSLWGERLGQNTRLWIVGANRNGAAPNNNIYACSTATMMCSQPASASSITANWTHVWGRSDLGVYAVSDRGDIWHAYKDGGTLERSDTRLPLYGIWASNMADIWAVGADGTILHAQK